MKNGKHSQFRRLFVFLSDLIILSLLIMIWGYIWYHYYIKGVVTPFYFWGNILVLFLYGTLNFVITHMYGGYKIGHHRKMDIFFSGTLSLIITNALSYIQISLLSLELVEVLPVIVATLVGSFVIFIWAFVTENIYFRVYPPHILLMIYDGKAFAQSLIQKMSKRDDKYRVSKVIDISEGMDKVCQELVKYKSVIFSDLASKERNALLKLCYEKDIRVYMTPKISDIMIRSAREIELFDSPILLSQNTDLSIEQRIFKRGIDLISSVLGSIILSPFMLLIALAIKIEDKGPIIYSQERLTLNGKVFKMYKFRSMVIDADKIDGNRLACENDPRITKVGNFIRKIRFDELPQLYNIFIGEMSLIGPRPEHPEIAAIYEESIPEFKYRLKMKAGLTGYAQVIGKYNTTPYDKLKMDLMYITNYSMILDLKIILMTFKIIFRKEATEGVKDGKKDAGLD